MRQTQRAADGYNLVCLFQRFLSGLSIPSLDSCWDWNRSRNNRGYGQIGLLSGADLTHRISYRFFIGAIPPDLELDHLCRNKACANPRHLEAVPATTNMQRALGRDNVLFCAKGHELASVGSFSRKRVRRDGSIVLKRTCKPCHNAAVTKYQAKRHGAPQSV